MSPLPAFGLPIMFWKLSSSLTADSPGFGFTATPGLTFFSAPCSFLFSFSAFSAFSAFSFFSSVFGFYSGFGFGFDS